MKSLILLLLSISSFVITINAAKVVTVDVQKVLSEYVAFNQAMDKVRSSVAPIEEEIQRMQRSGYESSLILIDIDMFKKVNDTFGHSFGDEVLKTIATITYDELRGPFDRIGRWGGEEFIILLNAVTSDQALQVAERIRQRIATTMIHFNGQSAQVTASFGFTKLTASDAFEGALIDADKALYQAKRDGRNCVCCNLRPSRKIKAQQAANAA